MKIIVRFKKKTLSTITLMKYIHFRARILSITCTSDDHPFLINICLPIERTRKSPLAITVVEFPDRHLDPITHFYFSLLQLFCDPRSSRTSESGLLITAHSFSPSPCIFTVEILFTLLLLCDDFHHVRGPC